MIKKNNRFFCYRINRYDPAGIALAGTVTVQAFDDIAYLPHCDTWVVSS
ncbi:MAG: hypothetical protein LBH97_07830 [Treponema sp.]|nr:hypothetical protein [Treponema sp.]